jgi:hypothetical protein
MVTSQTYDYPATVTYINHSDRLNTIASECNDDSWETLSMVETLMPLGPGGASLKLSAALN